MTHHGNSEEHEAEKAKHEDPGSSETPTAPAPADDAADAAQGPESGPGPRGNGDIDEERLEKAAEDLDRTEAH
jgi:hypothetical protein